MGCYWCDNEGQMPISYGEIDPDDFVDDDMKVDTSKEEVPGPAPKD